MTGTEPAKRIAVVTGDVLGKRLAGPGIRALNIATVLALSHEVKLASTVEASIQVPGLDVVQVDDRGLRDLERWCDLIVMQGWSLHRGGKLLASSKPMVCDLYDPLHLEALEQAKHLDPEARAANVAAATAVLVEQLHRGDFFLCASERQRMFWIGHLAAIGRLNPATYDDDQMLRSLIDVVPFGIPAEPAQRRAPAIRGVMSGIGSDDQVVVWGGGLYNWLDPVTVVRAVDRARTRLPQLRLFFLGSGHPSPAVPEMKIAGVAKALADELGLTNKHVFFNDHWVEHDRLGDYLLDADIGVSAHPDHLEAALSYRARILDYFWAGLPVVVTRGDVLAEFVEQHDLGRTVPAGDPDALADAVVELLADSTAMARCRANVGEVTAGLTWARCLEPLERFCARGSRAPDADALPNRLGASLAKRGAQLVRRITR